FSRHLLPLATVVLPYTTPFRSGTAGVLDDPPEHRPEPDEERDGGQGATEAVEHDVEHIRHRHTGECARRHARRLRWHPGLRRAPDRQSTRLNSSHVSISYAVFR